MLMSVFRMSTGLDKFGDRYGHTSMKAGSFICQLREHMRTLLRGE